MKTKATIEKLNIVDELIAERAPFLSSKPRLWKVLRKFLDPLLRYQEAVKLAKVVQNQSGMQTLSMCSKQLNLKVTVSNIERIPASGPCIIVCNHPTGLADGIAIHDALINVRKDFMIYANSDAFRVTEKFSDVFIPIELDPTAKGHTKTKLALVETRKALEVGKAIVIFPSGRLSYLTLRGLKERIWKPSFVRIAKKYQVPIIPMNMKARNSWLFYTFALLSNELRDISLFYELLNKSGKDVEMKVSRSIPYDTFSSSDTEVFCEALQAYVENLS